MAWEAWEIAAADIALGLDESPPVKVLIPDPTGIPDVIAIKGLIGKGVLENTFRIYQDFEFTSYFEVPTRADILHVDDLGKTQRVWLVNKEYRFVTRNAYRAEVDFLRGGIASRAGEVQDIYQGSADFGPDPSNNCRCPQTSH